MLFWKASLEGSWLESLATLHQLADEWRNHEQIVSYTLYKANPCSVPET